MAILAPAPSTALRAAIYRRVSTLEQGQRGHSLDAQAQDCAALAAELGATLIGEPFTDRDSGAEWNLPGLNAMLDAAKRRAFDVLLVYDPDRLARNMAKQLVVEEDLKRAGVVIRYVTLRLGDTAEDYLLKNMRSAIAEYERSKIALRTSRGRRAKAERGLIVGNGWAPYGYRFTYDTDGRVVGLEEDPATAPVVRRIFTDLTQHSLNEVCRRLNAEGVPTYFQGRTRRGKPLSGRWRDSTILGIVQNPVYLGTAAYGRRDTHKQLRPPDTWLTIAVPALIDRDTWDAAHAAMAQRRDRRPAKRPDLEHVYELRGRLTCGHCGGAVATQINNGHRYYACLRREAARAAFQGKPRCTLPPVPSALLDAEAWQLTSAALLDKERLAMGLRAAREQHSDADTRQRERLDAVDREIARLRARFDRITDERLDATPGSETDRALRSKAHEVEAAINRLLADRAKLAAAPMPGISETESLQLCEFAAEVRAGIEHATPAERRRVYELLRLEGTVRLDPEQGVQLGRRHRFSIAWTSVLDLSHDTREVKKTRVEYFTDDYADWERKFLGEVKISLGGVPAPEPAAAPA
ncbi:MAG TPA: recombinase family protein [Chloroflexota bacterium]|nr:recombinase family protein [Chloroflexota bacterium]